jgi:hypothetical protein
MPLLHFTPPYKHKTTYTIFFLPLMKYFIN